MGGEWSCGSVLVAETWPAEHRGKAMGLMQAGWAIGALIAAGASAMILAHHSWRVLFLIGALPAIAAFFIRARGRATVWRDRPREASRWARCSRAAVPAPHRHRHAALQRRAHRLLGRDVVAPRLPGHTVAIGRRGPDRDDVGEMADRAAGRGVLRLHQLRLDRRPHQTPSRLHLLHDRGGDTAGPAARVLARTPMLLLLTLGPLLGFLRTATSRSSEQCSRSFFPTRIRAGARGFCYNGGRLALNRGAARRQASRTHTASRW